MLTQPPTPTMTFWCFFSTDALLSLPKNPPQLPRDRQFSWIPGAGRHHLERPSGFGGGGRKTSPWSRCPSRMPSHGLESPRNAVQDPPPLCRQTLPDQGSAWKAEQNPKIKICDPAGAVRCGSPPDEPDSWSSRAKQPPLM